MYLRRFYLLLIAVFCLNAAVYAGSGAGKVIDIQVRHNEFFVRIDSSANNFDTCVFWDHQFGVDLTVAGAQGMLALLLSAKAQNESVLIRETSSCLTGTGAKIIDNVNLGPFGQ